MQDFETGSLWSHISGECIMGELEGAKLTLYPSSQTTFNEFKMNYPNGLLLSKPEKGSSGSQYDSYFAAEEKLGMFGRVDNYQKLKGKAIVYGVAIDSWHGAVSKEYLEKNGFAWLDSGAPVLVTYASESATTVAFSMADLGKDVSQSVTMDSDKIILGDSGNQTVWNARTGKIVTGSADDLTQVPIMSAYWFAWVSFFPETALVY